MKAQERITHTRPIVRSAVVTFLQLKKLIGFVVVAVYNIDARQNERRKKRKCLQQYEYVSHINEEERRRSLIVRYSSRICNEHAHKLF